MRLRAAGSTHFNHHCVFFFLFKFFSQLHICNLDLIPFLFCFPSWSFANFLGFSWGFEVLTFPPFCYFGHLGSSLGVIPPVWESFSAFIFAIINSYSLLLTFGPDTQRPVLVSISEVGKGLGKGKWSTTQCPATQIRSWFPRRERDL